MDFYSRPTKADGFDPVVTLLFSAAAFRSLGGWRVLVDANEINVTAIVEGLKVVNNLHDWEIRKEFYNWPDAYILSVRRHSDIKFLGRSPNPI